MARYGIPYQGSKNAIAKDIVKLLPRANKLYDVFAGGCAITHCAVLTHKWSKYHINDISDSVVLFRDALRGKYHNERRWISRADFERLKDKDPYVRYCWSFGNGGNDYMYNTILEELKHALHDAHFASNRDERRKAMERYRDERRKAQRLDELQSLEGLQRLQSLERLESLEVTQLDYRALKFDADSVIYCDPPYKGTAGYNNKDFDHQAFYDWCLNQEQPLFISEYSMPSDFVCVAQFSKAAIFSQKGASKKVIEKLFRPRKQVIGD